MDTSDIFFTGLFLRLKNSHLYKSIRSTSKFFGIFKNWFEIIFLLYWSDNIFFSFYPRMINLKRGREREFNFGFDFHFSFARLFIVAGKIACIWKEKSSKWWAKYVPVASSVLNHHFIQLNCASLWHNIRGFPLGLDVINLIPYRGFDRLDFFGYRSKFHRSYAIENCSGFVSFVESSDAIWNYKLHWVFRPSQGRKEKS